MSQNFAHKELHVVKFNETSIDEFQERTLPLDFCEDLSSGNLYIGLGPLLKNLCPTRVRDHYGTHIRNKSYLLKVVSTLFFKCKCQLATS